MSPEPAPPAGPARRWRPPFLALAAVAAAVLSVVVIVALQGGQEPSPSLTPAASPSATGGPVAPPPSGSTSVGPTFDAAAIRAPTARGRPIWFGQGHWWAILHAGPTSEQRIFRLDPADGRWLDTGTLVDERADAVVATVDLEDGGVAVLSGGRGSTERSALRYQAFAFDPELDRYQLAPDQPVPLSAAGADQLSIARDGLGRLWVAYVEGGRATVRATDDGYHWSAPLAPAAIGPMGPDDALAVVAGGDVVGLVRTDVGESVVTFLPLADPGAADGRAMEEVVRTTLSRRGHVDAMGLPDGRVVAAFQTGESSVAGAGDLAPQILVAIRATDGSWSRAVFSRVRDAHVDPIVAVDLDDGVLYTMATAPATGGTVLYKRTTLDRPVFDPGPGTSFIADAAAPGTEHPVTGSRPVDAASGLVVLAADPDSGRYVTGRLAGPAGGQPAATPLPTVDQVLVDDTFDPWSPGDTPPSAWELRAGDPGALAIGGDEARTLVLSTTAADAGARVCRSFAPAAEAPLTVEAVVRAAISETDDASLLQVRGPGFPLVDVRADRNGVFAYFDGPEKTRTEVPFRAGTWYRVRVVVEPSGRWDLEIGPAADPGAVLVSATDLAPREQPTGTADRACVETSSGRVGLVVEVDSLKASAPRP